MPTNLVDEINSLLEDEYGKTLIPYDTGVTTITSPGLNVLLGNVNEVITLALWQIPKVQVLLAYLL